MGECRCEFLDPVLEAAFTAKDKEGWGRTREKPKKIPPFTICSDLDYVHDDWEGKLTGLGKDGSKPSSPASPTEKEIPLPNFVGAIPLTRPPPLVRFQFGKPIVDVPTLP